MRSSRRTEVDEDYEIDELQLNEEDYELQFNEEDYDGHDDNEIEEQEQEKVITCRVGWLTKLVLKRVFCCLINSLNYLNQGLQGRKT